MNETAIWREFEQKLAALYIKLTGDEKMGTGRYNDEVLEHFMVPHNCGVIEQPDGVGVAGDPDCGDCIKIFIRVKEGYIADISFQAAGCPAAIACSSALTELVKGKHIDEAAQVTDNEVVETLGGLPEWKCHCSAIAARALGEAIIDYLFGDR